jgi:hypothetical protein
MATILPEMSFIKDPGSHPMLLAQNEGFMIRSTVPATGTWAFSVTVEWDEVPKFLAGY